MINCNPSEWGQRCRYIVSFVSHKCALIPAPSAMPIIFTSNFQRHNTNFVFVADKFTIDTQTNQKLILLLLTKVQKTRPEIFI